jgi:hypothetical protein
LALLLHEVIQAAGTNWPRIVRVTIVALDISTTNAAWLVTVIWLEFG